MALQVDVIPATGTEYFTTNIEDGVALADARCATARARLPDPWPGDSTPGVHVSVLGIDLHPDVLPLSNLPAVLAPFLLRPDHVMSIAG